MNPLVEANLSLLVLSRETSSSLIYLAIVMVRYGFAGRKQPANAVVAFSQHCLALRSLTWHGYDGNETEPSNMYPW